MPTNVSLLSCCSSERLVSTCGFLQTRSFVSLTSLFTPAQLHYVNRCYKAKAREMNSVLTINDLTATDADGDNIISPDELVDLLAQKGIHITHEEVR